MVDGKFLGDVEQFVIVVEGGSAEVAEMWDSSEV